MRKILLAATVLTLVLTAAGLLTTTPADAAFYNQGVKDIDYSSAEETCTQGLFACTPNAGDGQANVLRITQHEQLHGDLEFDGYETTSLHPERVWMAASIGAECRTGYKLHDVSINGGWFYGSIDYQNPVEVDAPAAGTWTGATISVPDAKEMPDKVVALNIPMESLFDGEGRDGLLFGHDSIEDLYDHGESVIQSRVAAGMTEEQAREDGFSQTAWIATYASVTCEGNAFGTLRGKNMPYYLPLTVEFVPEASTDAGRPVAGDGGIKVESSVTQATLSVLTDPADECILHLSGTITANGGTDVTYRFIDPYGRRTGSYSVEVQDGFPAFVSHEVPIPAATPGQGASPGIHTELSEAPTGKYSGTMQLEVTSPNTVLSAPAGFSVDPCSHGTVNEDIERPSDDLVVPTRPDQGGTNPGGGLATTSPTTPTTTVPSGPGGRFRPGGLAG